MFQSLSISSSKILMNSWLNLNIPIPHNWHCWILQRHEVHSMAVPRETLQVYHWCCTDINIWKKGMSSQVIFLGPHIFSMVLIISKFPQLWRPFPKGTNTLGFQACPVNHWGYESSNRTRDDASTGPIQVHEENQATTLCICRMWILLMSS